MAIGTFPGMLQEGDHAGRPAATAVGSGALYACSTHALIYQSDGATWSTWAALGGGAPAAHAASHESGGSDEIDVTGLVGAGGGGGSYTIDAIATGVATEVTPTGTVAWQDGIDGLSGRAILSASMRSVASNDVSAQLIPIGSATQIETAFRVGGNHQNYAMAGPCFTDGTAATSEILWGNYTFGTGIAGGALYIYRGGTITAYGAAFTEYTPGLMLNGSRPLIFLRLTKVAANTWRLEYSLDGALWDNFGISDVAETLTPTHMGVAISTEGGAGRKFVTFEYFRHNG